MQQVSQDYMRSRSRNGGAPDVLRGIGAVLSEQVEVPQLRALAYLAGRRLAAERPLGACETLSDLQREANRILADMDWGWLRVESGADDVQFVHGCTPLRAWFGTEALAWSTALFEGVYAEWLRHVGADDQLDLRQNGGVEGTDDVVRYRLAHMHQFEQGRGQA